MGFIVTILLRVLTSVFLKIIFSIASEEVIAGLVFKLLHKLTTYTKTDKDDILITKLEEIYNKNSDQNSVLVEKTITHLKGLNEE